MVNIIFYIYIINLTNFMNFIGYVEKNVHKKISPI